jgi:hypothetical protein
VPEHFRVLDAGWRKGETWGRILAFKSCRILLIPRGACGVLCLWRESEGSGTWECGGMGNGIGVASSGVFFILLMENVGER